MDDSRFERCLRDLNFCAILTLCIVVTVITIQLKLRAEVRKL